MICAFLSYIPQESGLRLNGDIILAKPEESVITAMETSIAVEWDDPALEAELDTLAANGIYSPCISEPYSVHIEEDGRKIRVMRSWIHIDMDLISNERKNAIINRIDWPPLKIDEYSIKQREVPEGGIKREYTGSKQFTNS